MKVLLFGHSYVNHLRNLGGWNQEINLTSGDKVDLEFVFGGHPGKDFSYFLQNDHVFNIITQEQPDIIVVILGGNSIKEGVSNSDIKRDSSLFFQKLSTYIKAGCIRLVVQVEPRFCLPGNRFGTPTYLEFERRRNIINNHFNVKIKKNLKLVEGVVLLGSVNFLNKVENFSDGVHLKKAGLILYRKALLGSIAYALSHRQ